MGQPKHALKLSDGRTMIEHVADALRTACNGDADSEIIILGPDDVLANIALPRARCLPDNHPDLGPLAGIEALLSSGIAEHYLLCACDTPMLTAELLMRLRATTGKPITMFRVEGADRCEPMPMRIASSAINNARRFLNSNDRSIHNLADSMPCEEIAITRDEGLQLQNINTPAEFVSLSRPSE